VQKRTPQRGKEIDDFYNTDLAKNLVPSAQ